MDNTLSLDYQQTDFGREFYDQIERLDGRIDDEAEARSDADDNLQSQIDTIKASSDVVDIVGTYAELEEYDTSKLNDNDIVKVLEDETHDDDITYYRWSTSTEEFSFVGSLSAYYSKGETDTLLSGKQNTLTAGAGISIDANNVISADAVGVTLYAKHPTGYSDRFNFYYEDTFTTMVSKDEMIALLKEGDVKVTYSPRTDASWTESYPYFLLDGNWLYFSTTSYGAANPSFNQFEWLDGNNYATSHTFNVYSYNDFTGTDGTTYGSHGLVPAPVPSDSGKFLKSDGAWGDLPSANNVDSTDWSNLWQ